MEFNFNNMLELAANKQELVAKEEIVDGVKVIIFSYMIQMSNTFDSELALEFRGSVFIKDTGKCISRPLPKFFNIGEKPETQLNKINLNNASYFIKHDGSMAVPVLINDKIFWKTKKSFYSDVAIKIQKYYDSSDLKISKEFLKKYTPIYEYVGPDNRIVLDYQKEQLIYLGFRDNKTGYFTPNQRIQAHNLDYDMIFGMQNCEGFVIHDGNQIVKAKTKWYLDRHSIVTEFNPKKMIQSALDDTIDDIIGTIYQLSLPERAKEVEKIRDKTLSLKLKIINYCDVLFNSFYVKDKKEFALKIKDVVSKEYFGILFKKHENKSYESILNKLVFEKIYSEYKPI